MWESDIKILHKIDINVIRTELRIMKKALDLTTCKSTEDMCDLIELNIKDLQILNSSVEEEITEREIEIRDTADTARKGFLTRIVSKIKRMFTIKK